MSEIRFSPNSLSSEEQLIVSEGFEHHSQQEQAPEYVKQPVKWIYEDDRGQLAGALTAAVFWDWLYIDELWVRPQLRGSGIGRRLMQEAEDFAAQSELVGIWLWTQSWQAEGFYLQLGYVRFAHFDKFPRGHSRIGLRKEL